MANLVKCNNCNSEVSRNLKICPDCGKPMPQTKSKPKSQPQSITKLIRCKGCDSEISKKAESCPKCGEPLPKKTSFFTWMVLIVFVLLLIGSIAGRSSSRYTSSDTSNDVRINKKYYYNSTTNIKTIGWMQKCKKALEYKLKDGNSAEYREVYFLKNDNGVPMTCGKVNSKNSFGAYGGFQRFISGGSSSLTYLESEISDFDTSWSQFCQ